MEFVIAVDCEGPACVVGATGCNLNDAPEQYEFARRQAKAEANAAARGLFDAGAEQVIVWDNHGKGVNLIYEELNERCDIFNGVNARRSIRVLPECSSSAITRAIIRSPHPLPTLSAATLFNG